MDAGLAAVIAGAAGAGGAALAAFGTSFGLLKQAKVQGTQAHEQWLRNHRQQAFEGLIDATDRARFACRDALKAVADERAREAGAELRQGTITLLEGVREQSRAIQAASQRVVLLADEGTGRSALELCTRTLDIVEVSLEVAQETWRGAPPSEERLRQAQEAAEISRARFLDQARQTLQTA